MSDTDFLKVAFERYFQRGIDAKEKGDFDAAKSELILAAETLKKMADKSTGALKVTRLEQVSKILDVVESLGKAPVKAESSGKPNNDNKGQGGNEQKRDPNSTETIWQSVDIPTETFANIAGLEGVKKAARDMIIDVIKYEEVYKKFSYSGGGGILMCGLPGNGKTAIARAIAGEVGCKFFNVRSSDIKSKWQGEAVRNIKNLFATARQEERSIIFFDEIDAIAKDRGQLGNDNVASEVLTELLTQIEGFEKHKTKLFIIAATNKPAELDPAINSRFKRIIYVPMPDLDARIFLIGREIKGIPTEENFDIAEIADKAEGYSGRDIVSLCEFAKSLPLAKDKAKIDQGLAPDSVLTAEDFDQAFEEVRPSLKESDKILMLQYLDKLNIKVKAL